MSQFEEKREQNLRTSFLSWGKRNGSLTLSADTMVRRGSKQRNMAPIISIFPSFGSTGRTDKNFPDRMKGSKHDWNSITTKFWKLLHIMSMHIVIQKSEKLTEICKIFLLIQCPNHFQKVNSILDLSWRTWKKLWRKKPSKSINKAR